MRLMHWLRCLWVAAHTILIDGFCPGDFVAKRIESVHQNEELLVGNGLGSRHKVDDDSFSPLLFLNEQGIQLRHSRLISM
jgi:hypothetical protein